MVISVVEVRTFATRRTAMTINEFLIVIILLYVERERSPVFYVIKTN